MDAPQIKHRKRKVLAVDPSSIERTSIWKGLKDDYIVLTSSDLAEALKMADREGAELVLLGADRPLFSYRSFFQALRKGDPRLPFLLLLGERAWEEAINLPFMDWLSKPYTTQSLRQKVQTLLLQRDWVEQRANSLPLPIPPAQRGEKECFFDAAILALAHEIKNPLVAINTLANLLPERFEDPEFRDRFSRLASREVKRINDRLEILLEYSGLPAPYLTPTYLNSALLSVLRLEERNFAEQGVRLISELKEALPAIPFDEKHLNFVLHRILEDGLSKIGETKSIRFSTGSIDEGREGGRRRSVELIFGFEQDPGVLRNAPRTSRTEPGPDGEDWSLGLLLAWRVMTRNHAMMQISRGEGAWTLIRLRFPVTE